MKLISNRPAILMCVLLLGACGLSNCTKFVQVAPPTAQLVTTDVFNNNSAATSAQTVIYAQMEQKFESYNIELYTGLLGDELTNYSRVTVNTAHADQTDHLRPKQIDHLICWRRFSVYV